MSQKKELKSLREYKEMNEKSIAQKSSEFAVKQATINIKGAWRRSFFLREQIDNNKSLEKNEAMVDGIKPIYEIIGEYDKIMLFISSLKAQMTDDLEISEKTVEALRDEASEEYSRI